MRLQKAFLALAQFGPPEFAENAARHSRLALKRAEPMLRLDEDKAVLRGLAEDVGRQPSSGPRSARRGAATPPAGASSGGAGCCARRPGQARQTRQGAGHQVVELQEGAVLGSFGIGRLGGAPGGRRLAAVMKWRTGRDLNPRYPCRYAAFRVRCIQPLCHLSAVAFGRSGVVTTQAARAGQASLSTARTSGEIAAAGGLSA